MAKFKGRDFLVQRESNTPGTYVTIGGMRSTSMTINNESVDVTDKDGDTWRKLLEGAGIQSMSIKLSGVFSDNATTNSVQADVVANSVKNYKLVSGNADFFIGAFQITSMERGGEYNKEETFSVTLESAGTVAYTP